MSWNGKSEGGAIGYKIFVYSIKLFGIQFAYFILHFVSYYFYLFLKEKKGNLLLFYKNRLGFSESESKRLIKRNFHLLGQNLIDIIAFQIGKGQRITYDQQGEEYLKTASINKQGVFLISAHIGNWDIAGNFLSSLGSKVNVVMYQNEKEKVQEMLQNQGSSAHFDIIPIKDDLSHFIGIYKAIKNGEFVCLHADRYIEGSPTLGLPFLGETADFPQGVFQMIDKLNARYSFVYMVKTGKFNYSFSSTKPELATGDLKNIAREFVKTLEEKVREYPAQWFNYYDFYKKNDDRIF